MEDSIKINVVKLKDERVIPSAIGSPSTSPLNSTTRIIDHAIEQKRSVSNGSSVASSTSSSPKHSNSLVAKKEHHPSDASGNENIPNQGFMQNAIKKHISWQDEIEVNFVDAGQENGQTKIGETNIDYENDSVHAKSNGQEKQPSAGKKQVFGVDNGFPYDDFGMAGYNGYHDDRRFMYSEDSADDLHLIDVLHAKDDPNYPNAKGVTGIEFGGGINERSSDDWVKAMEVEVDNIRKEYFNGLYVWQESPEEFYSRIFEDWEFQDELTGNAPGWFSTMFFGPLLFFLRITQLCIKISLKFVKITALLLPFNESSRTVRGYVQSLEQFEERFEDVPLQQKKEAAMIFFFIMMLPLISVSYFTTLIWLLFPLTSLPMIAYLVYIFKFDTSPLDGSRVAFLRYWKLWRHFVKYFPIRLVRTYGLDPRDKYVFCYHPHGIISFGAFGNFATDATGFSRLFPGIDLRLLTLAMNFYVPWIREILLSMGVCSCSRKSCNKILKRGPGSAIMLVVGGADESLLAAPGTYRLNVNGRKGFVRVALDNGAQLVPVLGFGENDAFTTHMSQEGSMMKKFQDDFKRTFGFATPIFWGRMLESSQAFGVLPHRTPIIAVVGKPIKCPKVPAWMKGDKLRTTPAGKKLVNEYHKLYIDALTALYDTFKNKWAINRSESMMLVGNLSNVPRPVKNLQQINEDYNNNEAEKDEPDSACAMR